MATVAMLIGGAILNAAAFTGGNALYHLFDHSGSEAERERHDKAIETLNKATAEWQQKRLKNIDFMNRRAKEEYRSKHELAETDYALAHLPHPLPPKPELSNFYKPSDHQKEYEYAFIIGGLVVTGYLSYKFI